MKAIELPGDIPEEVKDFIEAKVVTGDMALPFHYPEACELLGWQAGFRFHARDRSSLVSESPGAWQPGWFVIALNAFDDPFFIDLGGRPQGFPVYYAAHGAGRWDALQVATRLDGFSRCLRLLREHPELDPAALHVLSVEADLDNALWREVRDARAEPADGAAVVGEARSDPGDWQPGALVLVAAGQHKLKLAQMLARQLGMGAPSALALASTPNVVLRKGNRVSLRALQRGLLALGAEVEFRCRAAGSADTKSAADVD
mgnify:CR=1 FL=1